MNNDPKDFSVIAKFQLPTDGDPGVFGFANIESDQEIGGSVTISIKPSDKSVQPAWMEDDEHPKEGAMVVCWDLISVFRRKWRARKARYYRPGDDDEKTRHERNVAFEQRQEEKDHSQRGGDIREK